MDFPSIHITIRGTGCFSQSKKLRETRGKKEDWSQFYSRVWKQQAHVGPDGELIVIPAFSIHQALIGGAKKGRLKPVAAKKAVEVLHARLTTGIMIPDDAQTDLKLSEAVPQTFNCHSNGKRGAGTRVDRTFPVWMSWSAWFDVWLLDETLTKEDIDEACRWAGVANGLGRYRPENGGSNGRFIVEKSVEHKARLAA